ncbi:MAG: cobalamin-binding protein [Candidatus Lokiarchaeota archaeon]|nr:cobalamin-binding protein [Candidatus Lokiarchaeota archaeon]
MSNIIDEIVNLNEDAVLEILKKRLDNNEDPMNIMNDVKAAMKKVGDLFSEGEFFLPDLMMSGEILRQIFELIAPKLKESDSSEKKGKILLGTVAGDIHDIGKDIVKFLLDANGYDVLDLGVDVPPEVFVKKMKEYDPDIIALSGFLTLAFDAMKETIEKMKAEGLKESVKIMIGGGTIDERIVNYVGADAFGDTAMDAIKLADNWMSG